MPNPRRSDGDALKNAKFILQCLRKSLNNKVTRFGKTIAKH